MPNSRTSSSHNLTLSPPSPNQPTPPQPSYNLASFSFSPSSSSPPLSSGNATIRDIIAAEGSAAAKKYAAPFASLPTDLIERHFHHLNPPPTALLSPFRLFLFLPHSAQGAPPSATSLQRKVALQQKNMPHPSLLYQPI
jgi:hypothetical protein